MWKFLKPPPPFPDTKHTRQSEINPAAASPLCSGSRSAFATVLSPFDKLWNNSEPACNSGTPAEPQPKIEHTMCNILWCELSLWELRLRTWLNGKAECLASSRIVDSAATMQILSKEWIFEALSSGFRAIHHDYALSNNFVPGPGTHSTHNIPHRQKFKMCATMVVAAS